MLEELIKLDPTFTESNFKSKVDNIFVMLHMSVMKNDLKRVDHFISDNVYKDYERKLNILNNSNQRQMYDELNIKSTDIENVKITEDKYIITVKLISKYLDYIIDKVSEEFISGDNQERIEKTNILTFEKLRNAKIQDSVRFCPNCGHSMDINKSGVCEFCHSIYNQEKYDWVLTNIETYK